MDDAINAKYGKRLAERGHRVFSQVGLPDPTSRFNGAVAQRRSVRLGASARRLVGTHGGTL
jgi:hypothetical protein